MKLNRKMILVASVVMGLFLAWVAHSREPKKPVSQNPEAQALVDQAWAGLDEEMSLKTIDQALALEEKAVKADPNNADLLAELADEYWQRGDLMPKNSDQDYEARKAYFQKGLDTATRSLAVKETAAGHYWAATNLAAVNENASIFKQASIFFDLSKHMDWIDQNAKGYKYGATARFWSEVSVRVPGVVIKMVGQDPNENYERLKDAIATEPRFFQNYTYQAKFLNHQGKKEEALATLDQVLKMDPNAFPEERAYNKFDQGRARELWKQWTGKDYPQR